MYDIMYNIYIYIMYNIYIYVCVCLHMCVHVCTCNKYDRIPYIQTHGTPWQFARHLSCAIYDYMPTSVVKLGAGCGFAPLGDEHVHLEHLGGIPW